MYKNRQKSLNSQSAAPYFFTFHTSHALWEVRKHGTDARLSLENLLSSLLSADRSLPSLLLLLLMLVLCRELLLYRYTTPPPLYPIGATGRLTPPPAPPSLVTCALLPPQKSSTLSLSSALRENRKRERE